MINHTISNFVAQLNNSFMGSKISADVLHTKNIYQCLHILYTSGIIRSFHPSRTRRNYLTVFFKQLPLRERIYKCTVISKPGHRIFLGYKSIANKYLKSGSITFVSTSYGILTAFDAVKQHLGGEVLFTLVPKPKPSIKL